MNLLGLTMRNRMKLPCLLGDDSCRFRTIQLEFSKAKEILEMHMKLVHPVTNIGKVKSETCDRDTNTKNDALKNDNEALC